MRSLSGGDSGDREMGGEETGGDEEEVDDNIPCLQIHTERLKKRHNCRIMLFDSN